MAAQYLESPKELSKIIKESAPEDVLLVVFDSSRSDRYRTFIATLEKIQEKSSALKVLVLDIEKQPNAILASQMRLRTLPTMLIFKGGETVDQAEGLLNEESLEKLITPYLPPKPAEESLKEEFDQAMSEGQYSRALALIPILREEKKNDRALWLAHIKLLWINKDLAKAKAVCEEADDPALLNEKENIKLLLVEMLDENVSPNQDWETIKTKLRDYRCEEAVEDLLTFIAKDRKFGDDLARKVLLAVFSLAGDFGCRGRLANLLFI
ncbi:tetratricopeptide repeat protein [bacterium]|nr:tetratricopeptide repeat protein [bacterium]